MAANHPNEGPGKGVLGIGRRILTILIQTAETRLRLAVAELEEEKVRLLQIMLMLGLTMIFTVFGLMSLLVLIIWAVDPHYRLAVMLGTTVTLLVLALILGLWTLGKARRTSFMRYTRRELKNDRELLEDKSE